MAQNFRLWSAEANSDKLLGSAKPPHTEPSDWSAAKKTEDGYQGKGSHVKFCLGQPYALEIVLAFLYFELKI